MATGVQNAATVAIPPNGYRRAMAVNFFRVEWVGATAVVTFVFEGAGYLDQLVVAVPRVALGSLRESLVAFLNRLGKVESTKPPFWEGRSIGTQVAQVDLVDMIHMSKGEVCEIVLLSVAICGIPHSAQKGDSVSVTPIPVAMLRCELDFMRHFILALYPPDSI